MDVIVLAGGQPAPSDPLFPFSQGKPKSMIEIAGKPMVQWVMDALDITPSVGQIVVVGLPPGSRLKCSRPLSYLEDQGNILSNVRSGCAVLAHSASVDEHVLVVSADIPALTAEMVEWMIEQAGRLDCDLIYTVLDRQRIETRFPKSRRSFYKLKDCEVCGGDMHVVRKSLLLQSGSLWERIMAARKSLFKQASIVGLDLMFLLIFRCLTLQQAAQKASARLKLRGYALKAPFAEMGMDVDKPSQLEMLRVDLAGRVK